MELNLVFFLCAVPAVLLAGISKGGFGSGAAFVAAPLLALVIDPVLAVGLMLPLLMVIDAASLGPYWRKWDWPNARALMIGAVPGMLIGVVFYRYTSVDALRVLIGSIAIGFVAFQTARARGWITPGAQPFDARKAGLWGAVAGFTSFVSHAGGPPAAVWLLSQRLEKIAFQGTTVLVFWWINLIKLPAYAMGGLLTRETLLAGLFLAPVAIVGARLGVVAHRLVPERVFFAIIYSLLLITGTKLIWDALG